MHIFGTYELINIIVVAVSLIIIISIVFKVFLVLFVSCVIRGLLLSESKRVVLHSGGTILSLFVTSIGCL